MKHRISLFIVACLAVTLLSACGSGSARNEATEPPSMEQDPGYNEAVPKVSDETEPPQKSPAVPEPTKELAKTPEELLEAAFPVENAKRAAVVAITNALATDVFASDNDTIDPSKYHSFADTSGYHMIVTSWGDWSAQADDIWHVDELEMHPNEYSTVAVVSLDVTYNGSDYIVSNVSGPFGKANNLSDIETFSYANTYLTVSPTMIADNRIA